MWTVIGTAASFFFAGLRASSVGSKRRVKVLVFPIAGLVFGAGVGIVQGSVTAALMAAMYVSIPYSIGIDIAAGLGLGQALVIVYFHLGRADFIHR
jgi:hypothetical protein